MIELKVGLVLTYQQVSRRFLIVQKVTKKGFVCYMLTKTDDGVTINPTKVPMPVSILGRDDIRVASDEEVTKAFTRLAADIMDALQVLNTSMEEVDARGKVASMVFALEAQRATQALYAQSQAAENACGIAARAMTDTVLRDLLLT